MISGCYGAPVRTKHADLNKSEIKIPAQPAKEHHDLSATIVSNQNYSFRNKRHFNTGFVSQTVISQGLGDHQCPQGSPNTKSSVETD